MWSKDDRLKAIIAEAIRNKPVGSKMHQHAVLLKRIQRPLKHLNNSQFKDIYQQLTTSKSNLEAIQNQLHLNPLDTDMQ